MVSNTSRVFTMFWFSANCKLCLTHGHDFSKTTYPAVRNSSRFFLQNFHLNLLRCRCRNTKRFSASLNNCLGKLVQIAITDQNAWAFGDESRDREIWILCNTSLAWQRLHTWRKSALEATKFYCELNGLAIHGSDALLSSLSCLYCKLNGKRVSDQRSKCWRNAHERFQWSFCGYWMYIVYCFNIHEFLTLTAAYLTVFWTTVPVSRRLYRY